MKSQGGKLQFYEQVVRLSVSLPPCLYRNKSIVCQRSPKLQAFLVAAAARLLTLLPARHPPVLSKKMLFCICIRIQQCWHGHSGVKIKTVMWKTCRGLGRLEERLSNPSVECEDEPLFNLENSTLIDALHIHNLYIVVVIMYHIPSIIFQTNLAIILFFLSCN